MSCPTRAASDWDFVSMIDAESITVGVAPMNRWLGVEIVSSLVRGDNARLLLLLFVLLPYYFGVA